MNPHCTFAQSGTDYVTQEWAHCYDCFTDPNHGACLPCLVKCHKGHSISPIRSGRFFCDCGDHNCSFTPRTPIHDVALGGDFSYMNWQLHQKIWPLLETRSIYSPFSLAYVMSMFHLGTDQQTARELQPLLHAPENNELEGILKNVNHTLKDPHLHMANGLFFRDTDILEKYRTFIQSIGRIGALDVDQINGWVSQVTKGLITNLVQDDPDLKIVLVNAIYFKANWVHAFPRRNTMTEMFLSPTGSKPVQMMQQKDTFHYSAVPDGQLLEMEYKDSQIRFGVYLPHENTTDIGWNWATFIPRLSQRKVTVSLPKFKLEGEHHLVPSFQKLGAKSMFESANLSKMTSRTDLCVSEIIQKAVIIVDEEGTEAAAATAVSMNRCCAIIEEKNIIFRADRPFLYYIRHVPTNVMLFVGVYS